MRTQTILLNLTHTTHATLNPFQLARDIERQKKAIEARRRLPA
jgi:hypothetical protein